eukprot:TRINITY_DN15490_c0_g1_i1.p1 TRINITY_DN15490_c0_g1~~TRINITY_DN15490_c0_g1_i1.p1  ORF type:complete len:782 (+),score=180.41 TRINITY_DN15490_c0_g1_i1:88-2433(+)
MATLFITLTLTIGLTQEGTLLLWGEDGLHKVDVKAGTETMLLAQPRESGSKAFPPAIGGMCVDTTAGIIVWTENPSASTIRHAVSIMTMEGASKTELFTRSGNLLGCAIDSATSTIYFVEYYSTGSGSGGGYKIHSTVLSGAPGSWAASSINSRDPGMSVPDTQPGGGVFLGGDVAITSGPPSKGGVFKVVGRSLKPTTTSAAYTWGFIGQGARQADGSLLLLDSDDLSSSARRARVVRSYVDDSQPTTVVWDSSPLAPPVGYPDSTGVLQPSITSTKVVDEVYAIQGSPADTVILVDVKSPAGAVTVFSAPASMVAGTGIGPVVWVEEDTTKAPDTPAPDTLVPDTAEPTTAPDTNPPDTVAPGATKAPDTVAPGTTPAPDTVSPVSVTSAPPTPPPTPAPRTDCGTAANRGVCMSMTGCEWSEGSQVCIVYGSECVKQSAEKDCRIIPSCHWDAAAGKCLIAENCAKETKASECNAKAQCKWSSDIDGCIIQKEAALKEENSTNTLLMFILIALAALCLCSIMILLLLYTLRAKKQQAMLVHEKEVDVVPEKSVGATKVECEMRRMKEMLYNPPPIAKDRIYTPTSDKDKDTETEEEEDIFALPEMKDGFGEYVEDRGVERDLEGLEEVDESRQTETERELMEKIRQEKQDLEMHVALLQDYKSESFRRRPWSKRDSDNSSLRTKRLSATTSGSPVQDSPSVLDSGVNVQAPQPPSPGKTGKSDSKRRSKIRSWETSVTTPSPTLSSPSMKHQSTTIYQNIELMSRGDKDADARTFSSI